MKKIFTLLFAAVASIGIASAQSNNHSYQERVSQHRQAPEEKFTRYQTSRNIPAWGHSEPVRMEANRKIEESKCYEPADRFHARFEVKHHRFEEQKFHRNDAHRW